MNHSDKKLTGILHAPLSRRQILRGGAALGLSSAWLAHEFGLGPSLMQSLNRLLLQTSGNTLDSIGTIQDALAGGPSLLRWFLAREAMAQASTPPWSVVHIKVVNHVATPLVFRLGPRKESSIETSNAGDSATPTLLDGANVSAKIFRNVVNPACKKHLSEAGLGKLSNLSLRLGGQDTAATYGTTYRMNGWFAAMLDRPSNVLASDYPEAFLRATNQFDHNAVGLTCVLGLNQTRGGNHALLNLKLRANQPDLGFYLQDKGILTSPLGITAFMMGTEYDCAEGTSKVNGVLRSYADNEAAAVRGVAVKVHADSIIQSVENSRKGYTTAATPGSLTDRFDQLITSDPSLRRSMEAAKLQFANQISGLTSEAALESTKAKSDFSAAAARGMVQATGTGVPASNGSKPTRWTLLRASFLHRRATRAGCWGSKVDRYVTFHSF